MTWTTHQGHLPGDDYTCVPSWIILALLLGLRLLSLGLGSRRGSLRLGGLGSRRGSLRLSMLGSRRGSLGIGGLSSCWLVPCYLLLGL
jgi:hypothetical protein